MRKLLWLIVCLMTMVVNLSSCSKEDENKFKLEINGTTTNESMALIEKSLKAIDNHFYLNSKYDPSVLSILKTKIHVQSDSLILGEIYVRGRNSFDGGTVSNDLFIFFSNKDGEYFSFVDENKAALIMRMGIETSSSGKNNVIARYAIKHGELNYETSYEYLIRYNNNNTDIKDKKFYKKYLDKELGIN